MLEVCIGCWIIFAFFASIVLGIYHLSDAKDMIRLSYSQFKTIFQALPDKWRVGYSSWTVYFNTFHYDVCEDHRDYEVMGRTLTEYILMRRLVKRYKAQMDKRRLGERTLRFVKQMKEDINGGNQ